MRARIAVLLGLVLAGASPARCEVPDEPSQYTHVLGGVGLVGMYFPGLALSAGLAVEAPRALFLLEGFAGKDADHVDLFLGGAGGLVLADTEHAPYVLGGIGYLARGTYEESGHEAFALSVEVGESFFRSRAVGQLWLGVRGFLPLGHTASFGTSPPLPLATLNVRLWF